MSAPTSRSPRRVLASLLAGALGLGLLPATAAAADTHTFADARALAGQYIADRFQPGTAANGTADAIYGLAATGGHADVVAEMLGDMATTTQAYIGAPGNVTSSASIGKVMLAVQVAGGDPNDFAGRDLEVELRELIDDDTGALRGGNIFGWPLAMAALARTDDGVPEATADWYAALGCTDPEHANYGGFGWAAAGCGNIDFDTTAQALQILLATGRDDQAAAAAGLLLDAQDETGGFGGASGAGNANSTGLGGQALRAAGEVEAADAAAGRIVSLQFGPDADPAHVGGLRRVPSDIVSNVMATHQGVFALGAPPLHELSADRLPARSLEEAAELAREWLVARLLTDPASSADRAAEIVAALAAVDADADAVATARARLESFVDHYLPPGGSGNPGRLPGFMLSVQIGGGDVDDVDGRDLEAELRALVDAGTGAFNGVNAAFARMLLTLERTEDGAPPAAAALLASRQCDDGGFAPLTCNDWVGPDLLTTALAAQALAATGFDDEAAAAVAHLLGVQAPSGAFSTVQGTAGITGYVAHTLRALGETEAADRAANVVVGLQVGPGADQATVGGIRPGEWTDAPNAITTAEAVLSLGAEGWLTLVGAVPEPAPVCDVAPHAPVLTVISRDEVLPFTVPGGGDIEVAVLDTVDGDVADASFEIRDELPLTDLDGPTRVVARLVHDDCDLADAPLFDAVYDVQDTYPPGVGLGDTPAVPFEDEAIVGWADDWTEYEPGPNVAEVWQTPERALGPVSGANTDVVVLGDRGFVTLTFDPPITDGDGYDLAVYENSFRIAGQDLEFAELGYVEVSSDGDTFARFDSASRTENPVGGFGGLSAADVGGLAGKDLNGYGTPFDLTALANHPEVRAGDVHLDAITHVRVVDAVGDPEDPDHDSFGRPVWNPFPTAVSGGFDLAGVGALNVAEEDDPTWTDGWCEGDEGVSIAIDFQELDPDRFPEPVVRCALGDHQDGFSVLDGAGFETETIFGGGFLCTVEGLPVDGTADGGDACLYEGYWAYYHAAGDDTAWTYSNEGAANRTPPPGSADAWSWTVIVDGDITGRPPTVGPFGREPDDDDDDGDPVTPVPPDDLDQDLVAAGREAAGWLGRQLQAHDGVLADDPDFPDWGLTLDAVLGLAAAGVGADVATDTIELMRDTQAGQQYPTFSAGAAAKTLLAVNAVGEDATDYLDVDLEATVRDAMDADTGRFASQTAFGQSLAIMALATTDDGVPDLAVDWLLSVQCGEGDAAGAFHGGNCARPDGDHTGLAVQALLASGSTDPDVPVALGAAHDWLTENQQVDGSFNITFDGVSFTPNTNSTGLAGQALRALGDGDAADLAGDFVARLQLGCDAYETSDALALDDVGAIAYARAGYEDAIEDGITTVTRDQFWRAAPQAMLTFEAPVLSALSFEGAEPGLPPAPDCEDDDGEPGPPDPPDPPDPPEPPEPTVPWNRGIDRVCDASPTTRFTDITGSPHTRAMACLDGFGITQGSSDPTRYNPRGTVTRGQMASFLDRFLQVAGRPLPDAPRAFDDTGAPHADAIDRLAAARIVEGVRGGGYAPNNPVTRGQMASMIARTLDVLDDGQRNGSAPAPGLVDAFGDDRGSPHEPAIDALARAGIVQGYADGRYGPQETVTRDQMASFLLRSLDLAVADRYATPQPMGTR